MKRYRVTIEVTATHTVTVDAEDKANAADIAWDMDSDDVATGEEGLWHISDVEDIEEILLEDEGDE